ncbi:MAG: hypothetical protein COA58_03255 [Bacteroidetes bacterium]|nr:MAG: hypothetical protein COA58_03255 [Bacteroidota bacterium]
MICSFLGLDAQSTWTKKYNKSTIIHTIAEYNNSYVGFGEKKGQHYFIRTDFDGIVQKEKYINDSSISSFYPSSCCITLDNQIIVAGIVNPYSSSSNEHLKLYKIDSNANIIWSISIPNTSPNAARCKILATRDSGFVVFGTDRLKGYVIKVNKNGDQVFRSNLGYKFMYPEDAVLNENGSFTVCGFETHSQFTSFIFHMNSSGKITSSKIYSNGGLFRSISKSGNNYFVGGSSSDNKASLSKFNEKLIRNRIYSLNVSGDVLGVKSDQFGNLICNVTSGTSCGLYVVSRYGKILEKSTVRSSNFDQTWYGFSDKNLNYVFAGKLHNLGFISKIEKNKESTALLVNKRIQCLGSKFKFNVSNNHTDSIRYEFEDAETLTTSASEEVEYTFHAKGSYNVKAILFYPNQIDSVSQIITVKELKKPNLGSDTLLCIGNTIQLSTGNNVITLWNNVDTSSNLVIDEAGTYSVEISDGYCVQRDTIYVGFVDCEITIKQTCYLDSTLISIPVQRLDGVEWFTGDNAKFVNKTNRIKHKFQYPGKYYIRVKVSTNSLNKILSDSVIITSLPIDFLSDTLTGCDSVHIHMRKIVGCSYLWNNKDSLHSYFTEISGMNKLRIQKYGCIREDSVFALVKDCNYRIYIPTAFTPNSDQVNDLFSYSGSNILNGTMTIFNLWGEKMYKETSEHPHWNGTSNGAACTSGAYAYKLLISPIGMPSQLYIGSLTLLR